MSRVFVMQEMGFDHSDAESTFGELVFLLNRKEANVEHMRRVSALVRKRLWDYQFNESDYLLAIGAPAIIMAVGYHALELASPVQVLQWDKNAGNYFCTAIGRS